MSLTTQRLFRVIVVGGIGLAELSGCGGETSTSSPGGGGGGGGPGGAGGQGGFPREGVTIGVGVGGSVGDGAGGSVAIDAGNDGTGGATDKDASREVGSGGFAGFPMEGPNPCYPNLPPCPPDAARDVNADVATDTNGSSDASGDARRDAFPMEGPPPLPDR